MENGNGPLAPVNTVHRQAQRLGDAAAKTKQEPEEQAIPEVVGCLLQLLYFSGFKISFGHCRCGPTGCVRSAPILQSGLAPARFCTPGPLLPRLERLAKSSRATKVARICNPCSLGLPSDAESMGGPDRLFINASFLQSQSSITERRNPNTCWRNAHLTSTGDDIKLHIVQCRQCYRCMSKESAKCRGNSLNSTRQNG